MARKGKQSLVPNISRETKSLGRLQIIWFQLRKQWVVDIMKMKPKVL